MVCEMFAITEDLLKYKEMHTVFKEYLHAQEASNNKGKSEHRRRLAVAGGVDVGLPTHGCL